MFKGARSFPLLVISLLMGMACVQSAWAQQGPTPGQNVNMVSGTQWPGGDPFLQRQNEPSIAVSTRNPLHLLAGANDYRTVDLNFFATGETGDAWLGVFKSFDGGATWQSTLLPGYPLDRTPEGMASPLKTPTQFQAASDPVVRAGTNGLFFYSGIAFNRAQNSGVIFVSRFMDLNNKENGNATTTTINTNTDPIRYISNTVLDKGNSGQFLDKPWLAVDIPRGGAGTCNITAPEPGAPGGSVTQTFPVGNVYLAWSRFVGNDNTVRSKIYFSRSTDCGLTWSTPVLLSQTYAINQGVSVAIDPGTGNVYVAWRTFAAANTLDGIAVAKSIDGGQTFSKGVQFRTLPAFDPTNPGAGSFFDENTVTTTSGGPQIRTLAFPSIAVDGCGQIYVAWPERTAPYGDARIFMSTSLDGLNWSPPFAVDPSPVMDDSSDSFSFSRGNQFMPQLTFAGGKLMALYYDQRFDHTLGLFSPANTTNPFTTPEGYPNPDSRGRLVLEQRVGIPDTNVFTPFLNDAGLTTMRHTLEVRVAQFSPSGTCPTGAVAFTTARVTEYRLGTRGDGSATIQQLSDNPPDLPMFEGGIAPFLGDYVDIAGLAFVPSGGSWIYNTVSPAPVHIATWTDNRDVQPPADGDWTHYTSIFSGQSVFDPTQTRPACNPGFTASRNQNIYSSRITRGLAISSPQTSKPLSTALQRAFVVLVQNSTSVEKSFRLTIGNQPPGGFASFTAGRNNPPNPPTPPSPVTTTLDVSVAPHAGVARPVFAVSSNPTASIEVDVAEISSGNVVLGGLSSFLVLNQDGTVPNLIDPDGAPQGTTIAGVEIYTPNVSSPNVSSPNVSSPNVSSPNVSSPNVSSPNVSSPNVSSQSFASTLVSGVAIPNVSSPNVSSPNVSSPNVSSPNVSSPNVSSGSLTTSAPVSDGNYTITNGGNTSASYHVRLVSTQAVTTPLQLLINKIYATPVAVPDQCGSLGLQQTSILLANVNNPPVISPASFDPSNTGITDSSVSNATFTLAPGETVVLTLRAPVTTDVMTTITQQVAPVVIAHAANTNNPTNIPSAAAPGGVFILTTSLPIGVVGGVGTAAYNATLAAVGGTTPYTWSVAIGSLPPGLTLSPGGSITGTPTTAGTYTFTVQVTDSTSPTALTATREYTVTINSPVALFFGSVTDPSGDATVAQIGVTPPDLTGATITVYNNGTMELNIQFAAGTLNNSTNLSEFQLDTDQNAGTGSPGVDAGCLNDAGLMGTDFIVLIETGFDVVQPNHAAVFRATGGCNAYSQVGTTAPGSVTYPTTDSMRVIVPLSLLPGARLGPWNFTVTTAYSLGGGGFTGVLDYMPNVGVTPASTTGVVF